MRNHPLTNRRRQSVKFHWNRSKERWGMEMVRLGSSQFHGFVFDDSDDLLSGELAPGHMVDGVTLQKGDRIMVISTPMRIEEGNPILKPFLEARLALQKANIPKDVVAYPFLSEEE